MPNNNTDLRIIKSERTQEKIKHALMELMVEKDFSKISVSDICNRLQINRGTFYLHYPDKYDLLKNCRNEIIDGLSQIIGDALDRANLPFYFQYCDNEKPMPAWIKLFQYEKNNAIYFRALYDNYFENLLEKRLQTKIASHIKHYHKEQFRNIDLDYFIPCICSTLFTLTKLWIKNNFKPNPEEMATLYMKIYMVPTMIISDYQTYSHDKKV